MNDLGIGQKYFDASETRPLCEVGGAYTYFADGDVLLAKITPCFENGKLGIARGLTNGVGFGSSEFTVIRPGHDLLAEYLYYFLDQDELRQRGAKAMTGAVGHKRVPQEFVEALEIPLPPLVEQRRIVAVLDEALTPISSATANAEKNISNARELARVTLLAKTQSLSTGRRPLKEICIVDWGNTNLTKSAYVDNGLALAVSAAGCDGRIGHAEHEAGVPVLSAIGARCGRMFFPDEPFTAIKNTITLTPRGGQTNGKFLFYLLESVDLPQRGSAQPFIAKGDINQFEVPVPKLEDQELLVQEMDAVFERCAELERLAKAKQALLAELKQSVLYSAFAGEPVGREPLAA
jgi:type I restriction enzyme S subunit